MPFKYDWESISDSKEMTLESVPGWRAVTIEYTRERYNLNEIDLYWRIKGTNHTFVTTDRDLGKYTDIDTYFRDALISFKEELLLWAREINSGRGEPWMGEYLVMYKSYIR